MKKQHTLTSISHFFFLAGLAVTPFQIFHIFYDFNAYASGLFSIYQTAFIHIADLFFIPAIFLWLCDRLIHKTSIQLESKTIATFLILIVAAGQISTFFAIDQTLSFISLLRLIEYILLYIFIIDSHISRTSIAYVLATSLGLQICLSGYQYFYQTSLGLQFLGEPILSNTLPGIAKFTKNEALHLRPYGTFPHPNILGGVLVCTFFLLRYLTSKRAGLIRLLFFVGIILTFSRAAWIAFIIALLSFVFYFRTRSSRAQRQIEIAFIILLFVGLIPALWFRWETIASDAAFTERLSLLKDSFSMLMQYPLGVGLHNFSLALPHVSPHALLPWHIQPVHNVFALTLSETGILGGLAFFGLYISHAWHFIKPKDNSDYHVFGTLFVALTVLMFADHYFWDIFSGSVYFWVFLGLAMQLPQQKES